MKFKNNKKELILLFFITIIVIVFFPINILKINLTVSTHDCLNLEYNMITGPEWSILNPNQDLKAYFKSNGYKRFEIYLSGNEPSTYNEKKYRILTNFIVYGGFVNESYGEDDLKAPVFEVKKYNYLPIFPILDKIESLFIGVR